MNTLTQGRLLAVDDDTEFLESLSNLLEIKGYKVDITDKPEKVLELINQNRYEALLLDINMPNLSGMDILERVNDLNSLLPIIIISGQGNINVAVEAIKKGAYDYIEKPLDTERLFIVLKNAVGKTKLVSEIENLQKIIAEEKKLVGNSRALLKILQLIDQVASTNAKVLITGESGTGKELIAFNLYAQSHRKAKPYLKINCAAIPNELLESELFGHKKGSFTGAQQDRIGKFVAADGGTLFLDEIGDMSIELQAKLLRVLDEGEVEIIGENYPKQVDVRIISATNKNLEELVEQGKFRKDLYHRLNVINLTIPPLRERREDILPLMDHFIEKYCGTYNKPLINLSNQAQILLQNFQWDGNVRELKNVVEKIVLFSSGTKVDTKDIYKILKKPEDPVSEIIEDTKSDLKTAKLEFERQYIISVLEDYHYKITEAADKLGIDRTNLFKKMKALKIEKTKEKNF